MTISRMPFSNAHQAIGSYKKCAPCLPDSKLALLDFCWGVGGVYLNRVSEESH